MINSKFKCADKVWFWNVDKPISRFVYQISQVDNVIWYHLTSVAGYSSTTLFYVDEKNVYSTKQKLLLTLKNKT